MFALGVMALVGCGPSYPPRAPVSGVITFRGQPVTQGTITFFPADGRSALGKIQPDGTYTLTTFEEHDGALLGEHQVIISATKVTGAAPPKSFEEEIALGQSGVAPAPPGTVEWLVPEKFSTRATSPLKATVKAEENKIDFQIPGE